MNRRSLFLLSLLACLPYTEANFAQEAVSQEDESITESVYTREDIDKARRETYKLILTGAIATFGGVIGCKISKYIIGNCARYDLVRHVSRRPRTIVPGVRMDPVFRLGDLPPESMDRVIEAIFPDRISRDEYWRTTTNSEGPNTLIRNRGTAWMDKIWNFPMPNNPSLLILLTALTVGVTIGGVGAIGMGIYQSYNLPKEGNLKKTWPEASLPRQDLESVEKFERK